METGKPEVIVDPSQAQLADVAARTGVTVPSSAAAVSVQSAGQGSYRLGVLPAAAAAVAEIVSEESDEAVAVAAGPGPELSLADGIAALAKPTLRLGEASLTGPPGSSSGSRSIYMTLQSGMCITADAFKYHIGDCQSFRSNCDSTFYVYWVDGSEQPPHYLVILRQHAFFGVSDKGSMLHNADHLRGFGMFTAKTEVRDVQASSSRVELVRTSPDSGGRVSQVRADVRLTQDVPGGRDIAAASLQEGFELTLGGWGAYNRSAAPDAKWEFAQDNTLDGGLNGRALTDNHYNDQVVRPYPAISTSGLTARTYAIWRVRPDGGRDGRDVTFSFGLELLQSFMLLTRGWLRTVDARGGVLSGHATGLQRHSLDLAAITGRR